MPSAREHQGAHRQGGDPLNVKRRTRYGMRLDFISSNHYPHLPSRTVYIRWVIPEDRSGSHPGGDCLAKETVT